MAISWTYFGCVVNVDCLFTQLGISLWMRPSSLRSPTHKNIVKRIIKILSNVLGCAHTGPVSDEQRLKLYGLYKQATEASVMWFGVVAAWARNKEMPRATAQENYVQLARSILRS